MHRNRPDGLSILILDFGSQYTQLIARRIREIGVYCEIWPWDVTEEEIAEFKANGIILSGGPESATTGEGPSAPGIVFDLQVPVLGICYGLHTMAAQLGGNVANWRQQLPTSAPYDHASGQVPRPLCYLVQRAPPATPQT